MWQQARTGVAADPCGPQEVAGRVRARRHRLLLAARSGTLPGRLYQRQTTHDVPLYNLFCWSAAAFRAMPAAAFRCPVSCSLYSASVVRGWSAHHRFSSSDARE